MTTTRRRQRSLGALAAAAVAVLAVARFATASSSEGGSPPPPRMSTPAEQVAALEARADERPRDVRVWRDLAAAYLARGAETANPAYSDLTDRALQRAAALAPDDPETTVLQGSLAEAEAALSRLLDRRPGVPALSRLSYLQQLSGRTPQAVLTMQAARDAAAASSGAAGTVSTFLGDLRLSQGDLDRADAAYRSALDRSPGLVLAELGRASVLDLRGRRAEAIEALTRLTERFPLPAAVALLSDLQRAEGDGEGA